MKSNKMALQFRDYHSVDFERCLAIFDSNVLQLSAANERQNYEAFLLDLPGPYLILEDPSYGLVACGGYAFIPETHSAELNWGMVGALFQHQGLGWHLLHERLTRIKANPAITAIHLTCTQHAETFFAKAGFAPCNTQHDSASIELHQHRMVMQLA